MPLPVILGSIARAAGKIAIAGALMPKKKKKTTALVPVPGSQGQQVIDIPWVELKDRDITLQIIQLLRDQPLLAVAAGIITVEVAEKLGLVGPGVATASQGIMAAMGVAASFKEGGIFGGVAGMAAGGLTAGVMSGLLPDFLSGEGDLNLLKKIPGINQIPGVGIVSNVLPIA